MSRQATKRGVKGGENVPGMSGSDGSQRPVGSQRTPWTLGRRDLFRVAAMGGVALVPLVPLSACAPGADKEQEYALIGPWRSAAADVDLAREAMGQFPADANEAGVLGRIADSRATHKDKLAEAIAAAGHSLPEPVLSGPDDPPGAPASATTPAEDSAAQAGPGSRGDSGVEPTGMGDRSGAPERQEYPADVPGVLAALRAADKEAAGASSDLDGYPAALAASIAANCAAAADVEIGVRLGVSG